MDSLPQRFVTPRKQQLLLVEDDPFFGDFLNRFLCLRGYDVTHSRDGYDALRLLTDQAFDFVICDINLPSLQGHRVYQHLQREKPLLCDRFIFITGNTLNHEISSFISSEKREILHKPFHVNQLFSLLENISAPISDPLGPDELFSI